MKKTLLLTFAVLTAGLLNAQIAHYSFDNSKSDKTGSYADATFIGAQFGDDLKMDTSSALSFDGINDEVQLDTFFIWTDFSMSFWVKQNTLTDGQNYVGKYLDQASNDNVVILGQYGGLYGFRIATEVAYSTVEADTNWHHMVATVKQYSQDSSQVIVYRDTTEIINTFFNIDITNVTNTSLKWVLGTDYDGNAKGTDYLNGKMDEVSFWGTSLEKRQVDSLFIDYLKEEQEPTCTNIAKYSFELSMEDETENAYDGDLNTAEYTTGLDGEGLLLNGQSFAKLGNVITPDTLSISFWMKQNVLTGNQLFMGKYYPTGDNLFLFGYWNGYHIRLRNETHTEVATLDMNWHLFTMNIVTDNINWKTQFDIYRDTTNIMSVEINDTLGKTYSDYPWVIGTDLDTPGPQATDFLNGVVDEVSFSSCLKSYEDIETEYLKYKDIILSTSNVTSTIGTVYPNPTLGTVTIGAALKNSTVNIYSVEGSFVREESLNNNVIQMKDLQDGLYIIEYTSTSNQVLRSTIIKN